MTKALSLAALAAGLLTATSAFAQMYPGEGISVNPQAAYSAGPYGPYRDVIHLHLPTEHRTQHHVAKKVRAAPVEASSTPAPSTEPSTVPDLSQSASAEPASTPPPKPKKVKAAEMAPAPVQPTDSNADQSGGIPLSLAPDEPQQAGSPKPKQTKARKEASIAPQQQPATNVVSKVPSATTGLSKHSQILFEHGATDPGADTVNKLQAVASQLNTLLGSGSARVQLDAYGGPPGDKSSDSRRLSLKRALVIRQILIEDGIPSDRIDVRAMGGIDDHGSPDRVDVYVSAG